jgi:hypothetical protein
LTHVSRPRKRSFVDDGSWPMNCPSQRTSRQQLILSGVSFQPSQVVGSARLTVSRRRRAQLVGAQNRDDQLSRLRASRRDKCADEGKWSIRDERLCWELSWMGEALKLKTACSFIKRTGNDRFELRNEKTPELTFLMFKVL